MIGNGYGELFQFGLNVFDFFLGLGPFFGIFQRIIAPQCFGTQNTKSWSGAGMEFLDAKRTRFFEPNTTRNRFVSVFGALVVAIGDSVDIGISL
jgi:hypothetical protein